MRATAELDVAAGGRVRWSAEPPVVLRRTGPARVHLVQAAGGPLGGDELRLHVRLAEDTELTVGSAAATVAQPGRPGSGPARWTVTAELAAGARLTWAPEPTVVCDGADLHAELRVRLAAGAGALLREQVRLGRHGSSAAAIGVPWPWTTPVSRCCGTPRCWTAPTPGCAARPGPVAPG